jgi:nucleotide-binding universal stress UspA family protein
VALEAERQTYDMVVAACSPTLPATALTQLLLAAGPYHILLVPQASPVPARALVSVTGSEPGTDDVLFAGSLLHFLGAEATLLSILPADPNRPRLRARTEQFLADGARTLASLGIPVETKIRNGPVVEQILEQIETGGHDLLLVGAPLASDNPRAPLAGVISQVLSSAIEVPILIVRSRYATRPVSQLTFDGRIKIIEEIGL